MLLAASYWLLASAGLRKSSSNENNALVSAATQGVELRLGEMRIGERLTPVFFF